jgi:hypothetical protein
MARLTGQMFSPIEYAKKLHWYKCSATDMKVATKQLTSIVTSLKQGAEISNMISVIANAVK